ncbi:MAG: AAA domain-containing protein [Candidatus Latescibacteria bacterium]|nr:AAA domain-containing protein [Candidatus Latescibacterota bacterium]NIM21366.1 AAA domain-containing protein [Candidatus Latescibacterota bacterium]NIM65547.1 AAA domain-containing protein [Candidatus Latescibacterota bacterium]NIO01927.1 AAA domain-containing protein [Candidatus Latescibacterota bacterium]NIO28740.1 AAA domain-containing protein [Candidatus Latescibacterota bacterium]
MELQILAVTTDEQVRQIVHYIADSQEDVVTFLNEPVHIMSVPLDALHLLVIDEAAAQNYLSLIKRVRKRHPGMDAMVIGGPKSEEILTRERHEAVDYYYSRPIDHVAFEAALRHRTDLARLKASTGIIGRAPAIEEIVEAILQVGPTEVPILIEGESGTGKDVIARTIHLASRRKGGPFEAINCASLAEGVLESELFGHEKGAFTGAVARREGLFERADRGTVFLDEVGEMSPNMQVRLLRVLESGEVLRVGGIKSFRVDIRIIAATNRNLGEAVREGKFRQDLYYRLKGVNLHLPPLRDRKEDIPHLVDQFILQASARHGKDVKGVESGALRRISEYSWPGNIRELRNLIDTLVVLSSTQKIAAELVASQLAKEEMESPSLLPVALHRSKDEAEREMIYASILALHRDVREILDILRDQRGGAWEGLREVRTDAQREGIDGRSLNQIEREAITQALLVTGGNRRKASEILGISERTLYRKIKEYGLV